MELNPGDVLAREKVQALSRDDVSADDPQRITEFESYIRAGRFQEVEPLLAAYVQEHPKASWGWYALGYSLFAQRKVGESIQALAKSLQLNNENAEAHKILGRDLMFIGRFAAAQTEFFFGEDLASLIRQNGWARLPEWTGVWSKRVGASAAPG